MVTIPEPQRKEIGMFNEETKKNKGGGLQMWAHFKKMWFGFFFFLGKLRTVESRTNQPIYFLSIQRVTIGQACSRAKPFPAENEAASQARNPFFKSKFLVFPSPSYTS